MLLSMVSHIPEAPEEKLSQVNAALEGAKELLEIASQIINEEGLPNVVYHNSPLGQLLEKTRNNATIALARAEEIEEEISNIEIGQALELKPLIELDDISDIKDDGEEGNPQAYRQVPELKGESSSGEPFMDLSDMPFRGHGEE